MTQPDTSRADPRAGAVSALRRAIQSLRPHLETSEDQADLALIEAAAARLSQPRAAATLGIADFDPTLLAHLLQLTGPSVAPELLSRLTEDLTATQETLASGVREADWKLLREGSHVLISLSGSVGARSLQVMSENLNAIAHRQDTAALAGLMRPLDGELSALIRLIRATRAPTEIAE